MGKPKEEEKEAVTKDAAEQQCKEEQPKDKSPKKKESKKEKDAQELLKTQEELAQRQKELAAQKESFMRLAAEYDNYRKRTTVEKQNIYADATADAIAEILPVADSIDAALQSAKDAPEEFKKGLELVSSQLLSALAKLRVEPFGEQGEPFDPTLHNAVSRIEDQTLAENTIAQVFQKGYKTGEKIIRHAMVQVANCD